MVTDEQKKDSGKCFHLDEDGSNAELDGNLDKGELSHSYVTALFLCATGRTKKE